MTQGFDDWSEADQLLMGSRVRSARWGAPKDGSGLPPDKLPGCVESGLVIDRPESRQQVGAPGTAEAGQLLFWDGGQPKMQVVIKIQTDHQEDGEDDGVRAIYVKGGELQRAISEAVRKAGARRIEPGGRLAVKFIQKRYEDGKYKNYWAAQYEAPQVAAVDDFFGAPPAAPAANVPAQRAPQNAPAANADQARQSMLDRLRDQQQRGIDHLNEARAANAAQAANPPKNEWANSDEPPF